MTTMILGVIQCKRRCLRFFVVCKGGEKESWEIPYEVSSEPSQKAGSTVRMVQIISMSLPDPTGSRFGGLQDVGYGTRLASATVRCYH